MNHPTYRLFPQGTYIRIPKGTAFTCVNAKGTAPGCIEQDCVVSTIDHSPAWDSEVSWANEKGEWCHTLKSNVEPLKEQP